MPFINQDITEGDNSVVEMLDTLPYQIFILDKDKKVVFGNNAFAKSLGIDDISSILNIKPGEVFTCPNAVKGCGYDEKCEYCGFNRAYENILASHEEQHSFVQILSEREDDRILYEFDVTASTINLGGETYFIFSLFDISKLKENEIFQRLFFHDILNISGSLQGLFNLLIKKPDYLQRPDIIKMAYNLCLQMTDEILKQKQILYAEKGELLVSDDTCRSIEVLKELKESLQENKVASNKIIEIDKTSSIFSFQTDKSILLRVLNNMLKNALEAEQKGSTVKIGCQKNMEEIMFWVHNDAYISKENQANIFSKSFSTKGKGRGLGTYSIKLFGEKFLGANVGFFSNEKEGTRFYITFKA